VRAAVAAAVAAAALLAAGCGGGGGDGIATEGGHHQLIAAIGDSITAGYPGYSPDAAPYRRIGIARNPESQWEWWAHKRHPELDFRNCGVRGQTTAQIARRLDRCTRGANGVVIQGGINDLQRHIPGLVVLRNLRAMVRAAKRRDLDVAVADVLPFGRAPQVDPAIDELNRRIAAMARHEGATILHFHRTLEDPAHPGAIKPQWSSEDRIHPSVDGYRRLGLLAFEPPGQ
jgi:lysophospholipase L1-like esterase